MSGTRTRTHTMTFPYVFFIVKPDAVRRHLIGEILAEIEGHGLEITQLKMVGEADRATVLQHYADHAGKPYFKALVDTIAGHRVVAGVALSREDPDRTVELFRTLIGPYKDPRRGSIRGEFAVSEMENSIHGSDSPEAALRETILWFGADEVGG